MLEQIKSRGGLRINEKGYTETDISVEEIQWMINTIDRYTKALKFYALKANYSFSPIDDNIPVVNKDGGKIARKELNL